jgi:RNA-binding protein
MPAPSITSRQRSHLRSLAHALKPVVQVGGSGLTDGVVAAIGEALLEHELVKVKIGQSYEGDKHEAARELAERTEADLTQVIGRTVVLYRPRPKVDDDPRPRIVLP